MEQERLRYIIDGTRAGTWQWNVQTGDIVFNERWAEIIGYTLAELMPTTLQTWENLAHPDDLGQSGRRADLDRDRGRDALFRGLWVGGHLCVQSGDRLLDGTRAAQERQGRVGGQADLADVGGRGDHRALALHSDYGGRALGGHNALWFGSALVHVPETEKLYRQLLELDNVA